MSLSKIKGLYDKMYLCSSVGFNPFLFLEVQDQRPSEWSYL